MDQPGEQRRRALGVMWGVVFLIVCGFAVGVSSPSVSDLPASVALTALIGLVAYWPNLRGSRVEYDPSTPIVVVSLTVTVPVSVVGWFAQK